MKKNFLNFFILFLFFLMLALPAVTKQAANEGLNLWVFTVLPSILPYTIISSLLLQLGAFKIPCRFIGRVLNRQLPENEIFTVICGCLCGCPIGAKIAADSYRQGQIKKETAEFLMCACNNLSPSFLINYVFTVVYSPFIQLTSLNILTIFLIIIFSSLTGALITHKIFTRTNSTGSAFYDMNKTIVCAQKKPAISKILEDCILSAFEIQAKIGGYIILFTIITSLLIHTLCLSDMQAAISGSILEVTSGLSLFLTYSDGMTNLSDRIIPALITALTTFGGICTIFQTKTAVSGSGLSITRYAISKLIACLFAFTLSILILR